MDSTVRLWRCDKWQTVATLRERVSEYWPPAICFHPKDPSILATLGGKDKVIRIWQLDVDSLLGVSSATTFHYYSNAKVVLVGDTGVGKSGLALVLSGQPWEKTESTHGRKVWTFGNEVAWLSEGSQETRETLLWDLAGQPNYRLIHQLQLNEATLALVVFDSRSDTAPLSGVRYWVRALRQVESVRGDTTPALKKLLIAARIDVGKATVSQKLIRAFVKESNFDGYLETSAKEGLGIAELASTVGRLIDWSKLPRIASTALFQRIKDFLLQEKAQARVLSTGDDLHRAFLLTAAELQSRTDIKVQFDICIRLVEARGLIRRLSFGNFVLLRPELLDAYASFLIAAAHDEPGEMGCVFEEDAREGRFRMTEGERFKDRVLEKLILIATIEDMLRHEIAFREQTDDGSQLVFPSQFKRERLDLPDPAGKSVIFTFEGALLNVYATLAVRLAHSGVFGKLEMWKNAATYTARVGGTCGMYLREIEEGRGELGLFFDPLASEETRFQFEEYAHLHLQRQALPGSIRRSRIFTCGCGFVVPRQLVEMLAAQNLSDLVCPNPACAVPISLRDREDRLRGASKVVSGMDRLADSRREEGTAETIVKGKRATKDFDVFLCHNSADKPKVKKIGEQLLKRGILPWLDEWELQPGVSWINVIDKQIDNLKSAAVFVGRDGIGPWHRQEMEAILLELVERDCRLIPVLLQDAPPAPRLPVFLRKMTWVDFRKEDPDPLLRLVWGITGKRPVAV
jgi:GTPase SAR1 family protein